VVDDLAAAIGFFRELGLELQSEWSVEDELVGRIIGLDGVRVDAAMMQTPDGHGQVELVKFHAPAAEGGDRTAPANTPGLRHITFEVDDLDAALASVQGKGSELVGEVLRFGGTYRVCYVRGPEGIIVELGERTD
jgi:catechol 2,3-dioxygenase-like lactoylglutathione lyase family enzyme